MQQYDGKFVTIETNDDLYLGVVRVDTTGGLLFVMTGQRGRPAVVPFEDVEAIGLAELHELAEVG